MGDSEATFWAARVPGTHYPTLSTFIDKLTTIPKTFNRRRKPGIVSRPPFLSIDTEQPVPISVYPGFDIAVGQRALIRVQVLASGSHIDFDVYDERGGYFKLHGVYIPHDPSQPFDAQPSYLIDFIAEVVDRNYIGVHIGSGSVVDVAGHLDVGDGVVYETVDDLGSATFSHICTIQLYRFGAIYVDKNIHGVVASLSGPEGPCICHAVIAHITRRGFELLGAPCTRYDPVILDQMVTGFNEVELLARRGILVTHVDWRDVGARDTPGFYSVSAISLKIREDHAPGASYMIQGIFVGVIYDDERNNLTHDADGATPSFSIAVADSETWLRVRVYGRDIADLLMVDYDGETADIITDQPRVVSYIKRHWVMKPVRIYVRAYMEREVCHIILEDIQQLEMSLSWKATIHELLSGDALHKPCVLTGAASRMDPDIFPGPA
jgi:hypothetical protein